MSDKLARLIGHLMDKGMTASEAQEVATRHLQKTTTGMHKFSDFNQKIKEPHAAHAVRVTKVRRTRVKR